MCHKEWKMRTLVERTQPVSLANLLYNRVKIFVTTSNTLTPSRLRIPFGARRGGTVLCGWVSSPERGKSLVTSMDPHPRRMNEKNPLECCACFVLKGGNLN